MARTATSSDEPLRDFCREVLKQEALLRQGGGKAGLERQRKLGRLPARERITQLLDKDARFFEIGLWAAYKMYEEWGNIVAAGTVAGIGNVSGVPSMIIPNDATGKHGAPKMQAEISGTVDFYEKRGESCLKRLRALVALLPGAQRAADREIEIKGSTSEKSPDKVYDLVSLDGQKNYGVRDLLATIVDSNSIDEYKADYGKTLVTTYARIAGRPVGIVASQRLQVRTKKEGIQMGGVIYSDSADKAARFVMDCNQDRLPIIFFQDVTGFMVGRDAEQSGIIRSGAKLVNAVSNSVVPKITVVVGGSFGAGNYALCGKAYEPRFIVAWPTARYAVMGAAQASDTVFSILARARDRGDKKASHEELDELRKKVKQNYEEQTDIRYGAARGWVDAIVQPHETQKAAVQLLQYVSRPTPTAS